MHQYSSFIYCDVCETPGGRFMRLSRAPHFALPLARVVAPARPGKPSKRAARGCACGETESTPTLKLGMYRYRAALRAQHPAQHAVVISSLHTRRRWVSPSVPHVRYAAVPFFVARYHFSSHAHSSTCPPTVLTSRSTIILGVSLRRKLFVTVFPFFSPYRG